jgi:hypothetical protein
VIFTAMLIGAAVGALAGGLVYGAKVALSPKTTWNWADAGAAVLGGAVGGGLFPPLMAGLVAVGVPAAASYVVAGGVAWGGLWTLAEDAARWAFGRAPGLGSPGRYATATAVGLVVSATLLPVAARAFKPGGLMPHAGTVEAYLAPARPLAPNVLKAEAEFLAYGVASETANTGLRSLFSAGARGALGRTGATEAAVEAAVEVSARGANGTALNTGGAVTDAVLAGLPDAEDAPEADEADTAPAAPAAVTEPAVTPPAEAWDEASSPFANLRLRYGEPFSESSDEPTATRSGAPVSGDSLGAPPRLGLIQALRDQPAR